MRRNKKRIIIVGILIATLFCFNLATVNANFKIEGSKPVKVGVLLYDLNNPYIYQVSKNLEEIQNENQGEVEYIFEDAKKDQNTQNESIDKLIKEKVDLLLVNLVDINAAKSVINKVKQSNIPVILFNREPKTDEAIKSYSKAMFIGTDPRTSGTLEGNILVNEWNANKINIDRNKDGIMQYIMLMGEEKNLDAIGRTKYSIDTIKQSGIKTEELKLIVCNWDKECANQAINAALYQFGNKIEVIISNNDAMAIGAIEALQKYGYNKGDPSKTITVVGVDGLKQAQELVKEGYMAGTVIQYPKVMAQALYLCGMNLVAGRSGTYGTDYKFDSTGVAIRIPYIEGE